MKIFLAAKYFGKAQQSQLVDAIKETVEQMGHEIYSFLDEGHIVDENEMTSKMLSELDACDALLIEGSETSFGIGIEAGYARAKGKKVYVVHDDSMEESRTLKGVSDVYLKYNSVDELKVALSTILADPKSS